MHFLIERNWVSATNPNFIIPISQQPDDANLSYFKLTLLDPPDFVVWNIYGLRQLVLKKLGFKNPSLWQRLNSYVKWFFPYKACILDVIKVTLHLKSGTSDSVTLLIEWHVWLSGTSDSVACLIEWFVWLSGSSDWVARLIEWDGWLSGKSDWVANLIEWHVCLSGMSDWVAPPIGWLVWLSGTPDS